MCEENQPPVQAFWGEILVADGVVTVAAATNALLHQQVH